MLSMSQRMPCWNDSIACSTGHNLEIVVQWAQCLACCNSEAARSVSHITHLVEIVVQHAVKARPTVQFQ